MTTSAQTTTTTTTGATQTIRHRKLPHIDLSGETQHLIFRIANSVPASVVNRLLDQCAFLTDEQRKEIVGTKIEEYLDSNSQSEPYLADPRIGQIVDDAIKFFDGQRYKLHAWVIMPNHVHVVFSPYEPHLVWQIVRSWKSFSAKKANALLGKSGPFWQRDYYDRLIRNQKDYLTTVAYVENNPVKAGLCNDPKHWPFTSARTAELRPF